MSLKNPNTSNYQVKSLAFGGEGVVKGAEGVIFVPWALPEEEIQIAITKKKRNFSYGQLLSIKKASPNRQEAICPHFTVCGGCQLQHLQYRQQAAWKQQWVYDALHRIGNIPLKELPYIHKAPKTENYRRKIKLKLKVTEGKIALGYHKFGSQQEVIDVATCPIFTRDEALWQEIKNLVSIFEIPRGVEGEWAEITLIKQSLTTYVCYIQWLASPSKSVRSVLRDAIKKNSLIQGVLSVFKNRQEVFGDITLNWSLKGLTFTCSPTAFLQNYPEQAALLYQKIVSTALEVKASTIFDIYCGIGITSLLLEKYNQAKVLGIESNPSAIEEAKKNMQRNELQKSSFLCCDADSIPISYWKQEKPDLVLVNPPRTGLSEKVLQRICQFKPKFIIYVSCMPSTLARDLKQIYSSCTDLRK